MKKLILTSATLIFIGIMVFAQDFVSVERWYRSDNRTVAGSSEVLYFDVHGNYRRPVKTETLREAKLLSDFIAGYPVNWISHYASVQIRATCNGKARKALSADNRLSTEQRGILNTADLGTDIVVDVLYLYKNQVTNNAEDNGMYVVLTVIPDIEAEFVGGYPQMSKYLQESVVNQITATIPKQFQKGAVLFTVNEMGDVVNAKISKPSGNAKADRLLMEGIKKMPKWKPAQDSKGIKVKQEFEFSVGNDGC